MATITQQDVADIVRDMSAFYKPDGEACGNATPAQMRLLVERLTDYTQQVKEAASEYGLMTEFFDLLTGKKTKLLTPSNAQFALDMANWDQRLSHYRRVLEQTPAEQATTPSGCELVYKQVTAPLLDGIYYEVLPGTVLNDEEKLRMSQGAGHPNVDVPTTVRGADHPGGHSNAKPPDVITPFSLGNQVLVWHEHQQERARKFWSDLKESASSLGDRVQESISRFARPLGRDFLMPLGVALLGVSAATIAGLAVHSRVKANRMKREQLSANPKRRRSNEGLA